MTPFDLGLKPKVTRVLSLSGPNDATCTVVAFTDTKLVSGNADYTSSSFTAIQAGTYRWLASYSGDLNNNAAGPTACEIGRASCRERVEISVVAVSLKKKGEAAGGGAGTGGPH